jgi:hypothetical protein
MKSMNLLLVFPMLAMVALTTVVLVYMFIVRVQALKSGKIPMDYFRTYSLAIDVPAPALQAQNHFKNLFEIPVLFYAGCLTAIIIPVMGTAVLVFAWAFVFARIMHAFVHLGSNRIKLRMRCYAVSWLALLGLWILIGLQTASLVF